MNFGYSWRHFSVTPFLSLLPLLCFSLSLSISSVFLFSLALPLPLFSLNYKSIFDSFLSKSGCDLGLEAVNMCSDGMLVTSYKYFFQSKKRGKNVFNLKTVFVVAAVIFCQTLVFLMINKKFGSWFQF